MKLQIKAGIEIYKTSFRKRMPQPLILMCSDRETLAYQGQMSLPSFSELMIN